LKAADIAVEAAKLCKDNLQIAKPITIFLRDGPIPYAYMSLKTKEIVIYGMYDKALNVMPKEKVIYFLSVFTCHEIYHLNVLESNVIKSADAEELEARQFAFNKASEAVKRLAGVEIRPDKFADIYLEVYNKLIDIGFEVSWADGMLMGSVLSDADKPLDWRIEALNNLWYARKDLRGYKEYKIIM